MSKYSIEGQTLTDIADAIRSKTGDTAALTAAAMAEAIAGISGGGGGDGLEYEAGEWTPTTDSMWSVTIEFTNSHSKAPTLVALVTTAGKDSDKATQENKVACSVIFNASAFLGYFFYDSQLRKRAGGSLLIYSTSSSFSTISDTITESSMASLLTPTKMKISTNAASRTFKQGLAYKWIAVWAPEA